MRDKSPALQWYPKQILGDDKVLAMDWDARGMHHWLLWISWQQEPAGTIPDDDATIRRWLYYPSDDVWRRVKPQIMAAWPIQDGRRVNAGMVRTKHRQEIRTTNARAKREQLVEDEEEVSYSVFEKAFSCYPRKDAKRSAEKAWGKAINREAGKAVRSHAELEDFIYQRVMTYAAFCKRFNKPTEYTPYMATWLNQDRFLDDPTEWEATRQEQRNGNGQVSKATAREQRIIESAIRADAARAGTGKGPDPLALPGDGST